MRICRATAIFVVFEQFGTVLRVLEPFCLFLKLNFQAVIKSAASAASPTAWELRGSAPKPSPEPIRRPAVPVVPPSPVARALPCNSQAMGEAALAADLIAA